MNDVIIHHTCVCGNKYIFTEEDKKWWTERTICKKCTRNFSGQEHTKKWLEIKEKGEVLSNGSWKYMDMLAWEDKEETISYL